MSEEIGKNKHKDKKNKYNRMILVRVVILTVLFGVCMFFPLFWKLYNISITEHDKLEQMALEQQTKSYSIGAGRGTIYDRNMNALAISADVQTVCIAPNQIKDDKQAEEIADALSALLDIPRETILEKAAKKNRANEIIKKNVEKELAKEVLTYITENKLNMQVFLEPATKRYYPNGSLASNIIGFVGTDNTGLMGLEAGYDTKLTGIPGYTISARDNKQNPLPNQYEMYYDAQDGYDLVLTIDETIQHFAEKHLETAVIENKVAERACAIVMDVKTGSILAMTTMGDFDLNEPFEITDEETRDELSLLEGTDAYGEALSNARQAQWRNKAINDTYEPGSTFKVFTAAMALEEKVFDVEKETFVCNGGVQVGKWPISCHKKAPGHGTQTFAESLQHSCNPAFIKIGNAVGPEKFYEYMRAFGFMDKTEIDLQGESRSLIAPYATYSHDAAAQAVYSFGQTFKVTPVQMITAMSAVANGGNLMKPYVVGSVLDGEGHLVESNEPTVVRQVISADTSKQMCEYLRLCVEQGTGSNAYVKGYNVAGKTGTSQKRDKAGASENGWYVVSFLGFAPADDPQIAVLVMLDEPKLEPRNIRTGGYMAAPAAGRIIADTLPYLGVMKQLAADDIQNSDIKVPFVKNKTVADAKKEADKAGLKVRVEGEGEKVIDQLPLAGSEVPATTEIVLYTEGARPGETVTMPRILGKSPEDVNNILTRLGLVLRPSGALEKGTGELRAAWQEFSEGQQVPYGQVVTVEFRNTDVADGSYTRGNAA